MFTKKKLTGAANIQARKYEKVIDWEAVGAAAFWGVIVLLILFNL